MRNALGFTIIELMIVVTIVAIIASIGIPSYQDYVVRGNYSTLSSQRTVSVPPAWTIPAQTAPNGCWVRAKDGRC
jgi:prepilin-type N-terminal cleavage/methylation domain-containing protein